ncbi:hypothetical protein TNIN_367701 [Trichonephila inaurata madagascariensis]|uniref:Uncharacterized protein n=1 Tax=Trichonephila inaurata madagascariensis TaxID=2747483 RepID=A0A8X6XN09_9ARAC|nr:hypothetical protein TNIN_367701 [Trichonephila inaurata madagascariensis]
MTIGQTIGIFQSSTLPHPYIAANDFSISRKPPGMPGPECCSAQSSRLVEPLLPPMVLPFALSLDEEALSHICILPAADQLISVDYTSVRSSTGKSDYETDHWSANLRELAMNPVENTAGGHYLSAHRISNLFNR